jgi:diguanylate cyclase (GGDEF)-like protein
MFLSHSSVRARLFVVIAGMALLASFTIGLAYVATESERLDITAEARTAHQIHELTTDLETSIKDQESGIDDYLLSGSSLFLDEYHSAQEAELRLAERISALSDDFAGVSASLATLNQRSSTWRREFAEPAISAVDSRSVTRIATIVEAISSEKEPSLEGVADLRNEIDAAETQITAREGALADTRTIAVLFGVLLMLVAAGASLLLVRRWVANPMDRLLRVATLVEGGTNVSFEAERDDEIGKLGHALERMRLALQGDAEQSTVLNRFTEVTTFAPDDTAVSAASLEALDILVKPDAAVAHVLNRSKDRAVPEATLGAAISEVVPLNMLSRCPGIVRGTIYVTSDAAQPLSVHCPIYPIDHGTLACIPLAHGEVVGSVHLAWERPNAFPLVVHSSVARIAEHAALAIANRRLLAALQGMASTDARTGLANSRSFDQALEDILAERAADEMVAVLMLDIDHFKDFNDRYGHPAGDVALRAFSEVLQSCMRESDLAARYGGEEFAVVLPHADEAVALGIAERIRSRTETTLISLAPGMTDRITISIGIACAPADALDRVSLLRLADDALYRAKKAGRNRVEHASASGTVKLAGVVA